MEKFTENYVKTLYLNQFLILWFEKQEQTKPLRNTEVPSDLKG